MGCIGTQKCLSCPPGLSPVSFSERALAVMDARESKVQSWYFDVSMLRGYYSGSGARAYHHTAPVNMVYALRERLRAGLESMGISYIPSNSLHTLNCVRIPDGVDDATVRGRLLEEYSLEIGAGLGPFAGKAWRIALMGHAVTPRNVDLLLAALKDLMA